MTNDGGGATRSTGDEGTGHDQGRTRHGQGRPGHAQANSRAPPGRLIRTLEGHITAWSPDMQRRYGFTSEEAHGHTSHQLLRTSFPHALPAIEATLRQRNSWSGGLIHRHADGRAVMAANHWYVYHDVDRQTYLVTEVHSDIAPEDNGVCHQLADVLAALAHELSEPLTAIHNYVDGAQRLLQRGWPDLDAVRKAVAQASSQITRGAEGVNLLRDAANNMRGAG